MVLGMSLLTLFLYGSNLVVVGVIIAVLVATGQRGRVVVLVVSLVVLSAVCNVAAARSLGALELEWEQFDEGPRDATGNA